MKDLIVFDLDNTLVPSKTIMDDEMVGLFTELINKKKVAVMSGGSLEQFKKEFINSLPSTANLSNLLLFPTDGAAFYKWSDSIKDWEKVYQETLTSEQKSKIISAFDEVLSSINFDRENIKGKLIEDKDSAMTFSALGQDAELKIKEVWDPEQKKRKEIKSLLDPILTDFEVRIAGTTSIDITKKGQDKSFGMKKMIEYTGIKVENIVYIGDSLFDGGNDSPVKSTGVTTISVRNPEGTKVFIRQIIQ
jgi:hypothetical protein